MSIKIERLKERIRARAAEAILHEMNDPRMGFVTVTRVDLAADLRNATIWVSILGNESEQRRIMRALGDARGRLQGKIANALQTRTTPMIKITQDTSIEKSFAVASILDAIEAERRELGPVGGGDEQDDDESAGDDDAAAGEGDEVDNSLDELEPQDGDDGVVEER